MRFNKYRFARFCAVIRVEIPRRFCELLLVSLAFSFVLQILGRFQQLNAPKVFMMLQIAAFLSFMGVNVWLCRRSTTRTRYFPRYYTANILAYLLYVLVSWVVFRAMGINVFVLTFRVAFSLTMSNIGGVAEMLSAVRTFYLVFLLVVCLSPKHLFSAIWESL